MRATVLIIVTLASGAALPASAQQQTVPNPQMQEEADKGAKTRQSGESGYVGEQEKPGGSAHAPGRSGESKAPPTTNGGTGGTASERPPK
ncbi:hypothetical protein CWO90_38510 [Bradyrhizobium sp. Leo121]|nr:hypothetical protein CWO90_38510 [Bradyrhizobium sp. Leo121]